MIFSQDAKPEAEPSDQAAPPPDDQLAADASEESLQLEDLLPIDVAQLKQLPGQLTQTLTDIAQVFDSLETRAEEIETLLDEMIEEGADWDRREFGQQLRDRVLLPIPNMLNELSANTLSLTLVQARARTESVTLTPVDMRWEEALLTARQNRLDWMNARASPRRCLAADPIQCGRTGKPSRPDLRGRHWEHGRQPVAAPQLHRETSRRRPI